MPCAFRWDRICSSDFHSDRIVTVLLVTHIPRSHTRNRRSIRLMMIAVLDDDVGCHGLDSFHLAVEST